MHPTIIQKILHLVLRDKRHQINPVKAQLTPIPLAIGLDLTGRLCQAKISKRAMTTAPAAEIIA